MDKLNSLIDVLQVVNEASYSLNRWTGFSLAEIAAALILVHRHNQGTAVTETGDGSTKLGN